MIEPIITGVNSSLPGVIMQGGPALDTRSAPHGVDGSGRETLVLAADISILKHCLEAPLLGLIPHDQARSIRRNHQRQDRQRRILARLLIAFGLQFLDGWDMRHGLAAIRHDLQGRPWIAGSARPVSISHAGQWAVGCIGPIDATGGVGVDVEEIRLLNMEDFCLVFTDQERVDIRTAEDPASELIRRWTIKEAILKAAGTGFLVDPLQIDTSENGIDRSSRWCHLHLSYGYWLTVAGHDHSVSPRLILPSHVQLLTGACVILT